MKRLAALILAAAAVLSGCMTGKKAIPDFRNMAVYACDGSELRVSDVSGENKVIACLGENRAESNYKRLCRIYSEDVAFVPICREPREGSYTCRDGRLSGDETALFLTDREGNVISSFGSSFAGAARELAGMCDTESLRKRVIPLICREYGIPDGEVLLIVYKPTCRLCRERLDEIFSRRDQLKDRYFVAVLSTSNDPERAGLGDASFTDESEIYLKSLKPENNIGMYLVKNGEYAGEYK